MRNWNRQRDRWKPWMRIAHENDSLKVVPNAERVKWGNLWKLAMHLVQGCNLQFEIFRLFWTLQPQAAQACTSIIKHVSTGFCCEAANEFPIHSNNDLFMLKSLPNGTTCSWTHSHPTSPEGKAGWLETGNSRQSLFCLAFGTQGWPGRFNSSEGLAVLPYLVKRPGIGWHCPWERIKTVGFSQSLYEKDLSPEYWKWLEIAKTC